MRKTVKFIDNETGESQLKVYNEKEIQARAKRIKNIKRRLRKKKEQEFKKSE